MKKKLIMRLSNNLGNQMFMYAAAYAFSKKLDRELFVDEETAYQKNIIHEYNLNIFNFSSKIAPSKLKFLGSYGYLRRKILKYSEILLSLISFYKFIFKLLKSFDHLNYTTFFNIGSTW